MKSASFAAAVKYQFEEEVLGNRDENNKSLLQATPGT